MFVTCLGISGSGKTVFLGTLLDHLFTAANQKNGFYLSNHDNMRGGYGLLSDEVQRNNISIAENLEEIGENGYNGYPPGTKSSTLRSFSLKQGKNTVLDINWLDYKGGIISGNEVTSEEADDLFDCLSGSTAIMIFLDGYRLTEAKNPSQARKWLGLDPISKILSHLESSKDGEPVNIIFVLTQCDAICDDKWLGEHKNYEPLKLYAREVLAGCVEMVNRNPYWLSGIIAVSSIGVGNNRRKIVEKATFKSAPKIKDEIIDYPVPYNITEAFFWLIGCEVAKEKLFANRRSKEIEIEIGSAENRLAYKKDGIASNIREKEAERVKSLGFLSRILNLENFEQENGVSIEEYIKREQNEYEKDDQTISTLSSEASDSEAWDRTYGYALQPLIDASNNAVTKI